MNESTDVADHHHDHDEGQVALDGTARPSLVARAFLGAIHLYQLAREGRPSPCRYLPTCSSYAAEAISTHGSVRGSWLAVRRLCRCQPFGSSGFDPVPPPRKAP